MQNNPLAEEHVIETLFKKKKRQIKGTVPLNKRQQDTDVRKQLPPFLF